MNYWELMTVIGSEIKDPRQNTLYYDFIKMIQAMIEERAREIVREELEKAINGQRVNVKMKETLEQAFYETIKNAFK